MNYRPHTKAYVLNHIHCMLQDLQDNPTSDFDFELAFSMIEAVRDKSNENCGLECDYNPEICLCNGAKRPIKPEDVDSSVK